MAANTRDIRRRIKSIKNTAQITKAMQMVAAAKMRKAQQAALAARPYSELMNKVLASLGGRTDPGLSEFLEVRPVKKELVLIISTDKGLCGALNTNLLREVSQFDATKTVFVAAGRKAAQFVARTKRQLLADFDVKDSPGLIDTKAVSKFVIEKFLAREVDKVSVLYTHFVNTLVQQPTVRTILPLSPAEIGGNGETIAGDGSTEYLFEPSALDVLSSILPHYVHFQVYQMVLNSRASEHSARMVAMKSATDNAKQLIKDLTLEYNKVRQASITTELLEISTAQMVLG
ncbi:MAG: F-type H+-transporting ATPase subunit gamma [Chthoniobacter sp.]|jgi:F-type H+-transporting ATPase subunit gamma|nr:F-type H+-transporting ATPase subunit gamma [Chthoniobacter sp.]